MHPIPDRFECYELCVQSPRHVVGFLRALFVAENGSDPQVLGEDFSGTCAVSRRWCKELDNARAVCVDLDADALTWARARATDDDLANRIEFVRADCFAQSSPAAISAARASASPCDTPPDTRRDTPCDACFVGNFSIGYAHDRATLVRYLSRTRERLLAARHGFSGGVFACDTYGGAGAFALGGIERTHPGRRGEVIRYAWAHEMADPATSMVLNSISLRVERNGEIIAEYPRAFEYHWRLWSIAELREAMLEAGFQRTSVYLEVSLAPGEAPIPVTDPRQFKSDWIVLIAGIA